MVLTHGWKRRTATRACAFTSLLIAAAHARAGEKIVAVDRIGDVTLVKVGLKAEGTFKPAPPPNSKEEPKALALKVESRLEFSEKVIALAADGTAGRSVRWVTQAGAAINGEIRPTSSVLRAEMARLVAEPRGGQVVVSSTGGPLTRSELELVQAVGDPLAFPALLPATDVAVGSQWTVGADAARALSGYDSLASNGLEATVRSIDAAKAVVGLKGKIRGATLGGDGTIDCDGEFTFDRKANRVSKLTLNRSETRKPGPIEAGLDIKSTLTVERTQADAPAELADSALEGLGLDKPQPERELLVYQSPSGKFELLHDRDWHIYWDDARLAVLKRLEKGEFTAQCNLAAGPNAGKGRHQAPGQFRDDVKRALGARYRAILAEGEVDGVDAGNYRYRVAAQGQDGEVGILWYYYLLAGPDGDQVVATFTLGLPEQKRFGDQDLKLIGSFEWKERAANRP